MPLLLTAISIQGCRPVKRLDSPISHLSVPTGRNGVGRTNRHRALELVQAVARGTSTTGLATGGAVAPRTIIKRDDDAWIEGRKLGGDCNDED